jgi:hypothetical protein
VRIGRKCGGESKNAMGGTMRSTVPPMAFLGKFVI